MLQHLPRTTMQAPPVQDALSEERLGTRDVMLFARRYAQGIGICIFVFLVLGQIYVIMTPSTFVSSTQVVIESRRGNLTGGDVSFAQYSLDSSQMESQIQVIKSEQIAKRVVQGLDLEADPELTRPNTGMMAWLRGWLGSSAASTSAMQKASPAVRALSERLQARRIGQSYVIEISYWSQDPETSARICNAITAAYIGDLLQSKIDAAEGGNEILERRISTLRAQVEAAEKAVRTGRFETESFPSADARVITTALLPESRSWPRGSLVLAFSGLLGLFLGLLGAAARQGMDSSLHTRDQIARAIGLATLGALPIVRFRTSRKLASEVVEHPTSPFGTAIRQIRTAIQIRQTQTALVCLGITSTAEGEGKTTLAANLTQALATAGSRVLLVDGDVHGATLTKALTPDSALGMFEMLDADVPAGSAIIRIGDWQADFLPVHSQTGSIAPIELPPSGRIGELMSLCRKYYDVVLIDLPALESGPDAKAVSAHLDGMIFVIEAGRLRADRVAAAVDALRAMNIDLLGAVIGRSASGMNV